MTKLENKNKSEFCKFSFIPFFKAGIYADGKVALANVISAGVYAKGNLLDASLVLSATAEKQKSTLSLEGNFKAFSFELGIVYDRFKCSLNNFKFK